MACLPDAEPIGKRSGHTGEERVPRSGGVPRDNAFCGRHTAVPVGTGEYRAVLTEGDHHAADAAAAYPGGDLLRDC